MTNDRREESTSRHRLSLDWEIPQIRFINCDDVIEEVHRFDDLKIIPSRITKGDRGIPRHRDDPGYECSDLKSWQWMNAGSVFIPGYGLLDLSDKAKQQLSGHFKVRWSEAFRYMPASCMCSYLREYLRYLPSEESTVVKAVARSYKENEEKETASSNGILRGVVSPGYHSIPDSRVMDRLRRVQGSALDEMAFLQHKITEHGSHSILVYREPVELAGPSTFGVGDAGYFGARARNSDVGTYALSLVAWLIRHFCSNGMIFGRKGETLLYRQHREIEDAELDALITEGFRAMAASKDESVASVQKLHSIKIYDPEAELKSFLRGQPKMLQDAAIEAYHQEEMPTAFGVLQAITRTAMAMRSDPDRQYDLEQIAGSYAETALKAA